MKVNTKIITTIEKEKINAIKTIYDFDEHVTAPLNGFANAQDYYQQASGLKVMKKIRQPCLFIHAADDPFLNHQHSLPKQKLPENITFEVSTHGGHVGFIYGDNPLKPQYWLEQRTPDFLRKYLTNTLSDK